MKKLKKEILDKLSTDLNLKTNYIRKELSLIRRDFPGMTLNAAAFMFAQKKGRSIMRMLDAEDRATLPNTKVEKPEKIKVKRLNNKKKVINFFKYETSDPFKKGHIDEINKAYTSGCYTCVFILSRKIIENLIINILESKFPNEKDLYWNSLQDRYLDFSVVLDNLHSKKSNFKPSNIKAIGRLYGIAKRFKNNCNNKTHSLFHLVKRKKEIDDIGIDEIIDLIKILEKE